MLRVDLVRLGREGSVQVEARIPQDHPLWEGLGISLGGPVEVRLRVTEAGSGEIVVRGSLAADLEQECRRCLRSVPGRVDVALTMVFVPSDTPGVEEDGDVRLFEPDVTELDLDDPVREELVLGLDPYVVCDPECRGLCPQCGANRNSDPCACTTDESDPRWDALRALKS
jgi:uncharacterized protein